MRNCFAGFGNIASESLADQSAIDDFRADPETIQLFSGLERRAAAGEGIEHNFTFLRRQFDASARDERLQFIDTPACLEFRMACRGCVVPNISEIQAKRIQEFPMAAVVLNVLLAMTAFRNR